MVVAIPARNEAGLLGSCLEGVARARARLQAARPVPVDVVVALDGCTDASAAIARSAGAACVELPSRGVGAARDAAVRAGLARTAADPARVWIANTDADTRVPPNWLTGNLALAEAGSDLVIGTVEPVGTKDRLLLEAWHAAHRLTEGHAHVHGANLGVRASTFLRLGGFRGLRLHEDVDLVMRARAQGVPHTATDTVRVATSGRPEGRVAGGFADYLAALGEPNAHDRSTSAGSRQS